MPKIVISKDLAAEYVGHFFDITLGVYYTLDTGFSVSAKDFGEGAVSEVGSERIWKVGRSS